MATNTVENVIDGRGLIHLEADAGIPSGCCVEQALLADHETLFGRQIDAILVRAGKFKAEWIIKMFGEVGVPITVMPSEWKEDDEGPMAPTRSSAKKSVCRQLPEAFEGRGREGWVLNFATDVVLADQDGRIIERPRKAKTMAEIEGLLTDELGERERVFKIQSCSSVYAMRGNGEGQNIGLTEYEQHRIVVDALTPLEIELYMYGLNGRYGDNPQYLQDYFNQFVSKYDLSSSEIDQLRKGLTLAELKQTNMACRWPYPLMQAKINNVNGVSRGEEGFEEEMSNAFWALLGAPLSSRDMVEHFIVDSNLVDSVDPNGSLYPDLPGIWSHLIHVGDSVFSISRVVEGDCQGVSDMAVWNFNNAKNYVYLSEEERKAYCQANDQQGVWETSSNSRNIAALVVKRVCDGSDIVVGWEVIRGCQQQPRYAECRRIHIGTDGQGKGLGKRLLAVSEALARDAGYVAVVVNASGESAAFFENRGYKVLGKLKSDSGVFAGDAPKPNIVRLIKRI